MQVKIKVKVKQRYIILYTLDMRKNQH